MEQSLQDQRFMRAAIVEAARGDAAKTSPNPRVGAVIVEDGMIVASGHFEQDGGQHAERWALQNLGRAPAPGATMYVTLEPCSTQGRTGACTDALIAAGVGRVVIGAMDPTVEHRGHGVDVLQAAGIEVVSGVVEDECAALNPRFAGRTTGR